MFAKKITPNQRADRGTTRLCVFNPPKRIGRSFNPALLPHLEELLGLPALKVYEGDAPWPWKELFFSNTLNTLRIVLFPFLLTPDIASQLSGTNFFPGSTLAGLRLVYNPILVTMLEILAREVVPVVCSEHIMYALDVFRRQVSTPLIWENLQNANVRRYLANLDASIKQQ